MSFLVSKNNPALYITAVAKNRLPVFRTDTIKKLTCAALDEARASRKFLLFAYVVMPDHLHLLTDNPCDPSEVLRYVKGIVAHRLIEYLKEKGHESSLQKLRHEDWKRNHRYSLWQHESHVFQVFTESLLMQKTNYIHLNPVRAGLVERAVDYPWSSASDWNRCRLEDPPLRVDFEKITWRKS